MKQSKLFDGTATRGGLSRKGRKAIVTSTKPRLLTISEDDRQKLLSSRVSNILEETNVEFKLHVTQWDKRTFTSIPKRLDQYRRKSCPLWTKASFIDMKDGNEIDEPHEQEIISIQQEELLPFQDQEETMSPQKQQEGDAREDDFMYNSDNPKIRSIETSSVQHVGVQTDDVTIVILRKFEDKGVQTESQLEIMTNKVADEVGTIPVAQCVNRTPMLNYSFIDTPILKLPSGSQQTAMEIDKAEEEGDTSPVSPGYGDAHCVNRTPMMNYSLIDTPILKKELKRYGLKPLPRSKAKILLRHIYTETHK